MRSPENNVAGEGGRGDEARCVFRDEAQSRRRPGRHTQEHGSRPGDHPGKHVTSRGDGKGPSCDAGALSAAVRSSKGAAEARAV